MALLLTADGSGLQRVGRGLAFAGTAAPPAPWTPADTTTALWLDAADESTITLVSGKVSQWSDKSGNSRNAVQATASKQPAYGTNLWNSKKTISFASPSLTSLSLPTRSYSDWSRFVVVEPGVAASYILYDNHCSLVTQYVSRPFELYYNVGNRFTVSTNATTPSIIYFQKSSNAVSAYFNGVAVGSTFNTISSYSEALFIGASNLGDYFTGSIAEIIALDTVATTDIRQKLEGYLAHKWGLTASLPAGHPYKTSAP